MLLEQLKETIERQDSEIAARDSLHTSRNQEMAERDRKIAARDQEIAGLKVAVRRSERDALAAGLAANRARARARARKAQLAAMRASTSWTITKPLRWLGRSAPHSIIRLGRIEEETLAQAPYEWAAPDRLFSRRAREVLVRTYPRDHFKTVTGYDGEKAYEYEARALLYMNATEPAFANSLSEAWRMLAADLLSPGYRKAMSRLTQRDLLTAPMEAYVCHFGPGAWLGPHVDLKDKILTHVFYFNESWDAQNGGCLNILRSKDMSDVVAEILPVAGNSTIVIRSDRSWHAVSRVVDGCRTSRRSMNVIFYHPGAVSTMWPPGETPNLHDYQPPHG